jgi:DNA-binding transcriptional ArsR family regulator
LLSRYQTESFVSLSVFLKMILIAHIRSLSTSLPGCSVARTRTGYSISNGPPVGTLAHHRRGPGIGGALYRRYRAEPSQAIPIPFTQRGSLYALTRIFLVEYIKRVESVFEIIAEPNRRAILSLLASSQQSVGEIERQLRMAQPTVSKHLRVLRDAGFVESTVDAQRRLYRLKPEPLQELDAWLTPFRRFWSAHIDALERHLDRMESIDTKEKAAPTKRKVRRRK